MFRRLILVLTITVTLIAALLPGTTDSILKAQQTKVQTTGRFGADDSFMRPDEAAEMGVGWDRIIFEWRYLQPNGPDDWDTSAIPDQWLQDAQDAGRMVIGLIKNAPKWATGSDLLGATPLGITLPADDPGNFFGGFVKKLVTYYGQKWNIHDWIIYNEPDIRPSDTPYFEFAGTVTDYFHVVKTAYLAAKAADPASVIHLAGFTYWQDFVHDRVQYLSRFLSVDTADPEARKNNLFFDVLTVHVYAGTTSVWDMTRYLKSLPAAYGFPKPVWIDEFNMRVTSDGDWPVSTGGQQATLDEQASFIVQAAALGLAAGADKMAVYHLFDDDVHDDYDAFGLIRADGTRRPGYYALKTVIQYFDPTIKANYYTNYRVTLVTLQQPGRTLYVLWDRGRVDADVRIKSVEDAPATMIMPTGETSTLPLGDAAQGSYEFTLPACDNACDVQGSPRIVILAGDPQAVWYLRNGVPVKLN